jgi:hypothetical protein
MRSLSVFRPGALRGASGTVLFLSLWLGATDCSSPHGSSAGVAGAGGGEASGSLGLPPTGFGGSGGVGVAPGPGSGACAATSAAAALSKGMDIIVVIDNSGSMSNEIEAVERNINANFTSIIGASGVDHRVILLSRHGAAKDNDFCVDPPLSGNATCAPPPERPTNTARFFHYSAKINSRDSFEKILKTYNEPDQFELAPRGWSEWLRPGVPKAFIEITDDESNMPWTEFEPKLFALEPKRFGDASSRKYIFHSIVAMAENTPVTAAWQPGDPIRTELCTGNGGDAEAAGVEYQQLSKVTGGLRFPLCQYASFDVVFKAVAKDVITSARIGCDFAIPPAPAGMTLDLSMVAVAYAPGGGGPGQQFRQAATPAACVGGAFYIERDRIVLCPETCSAVTRDPQAKIEVLFTCEKTLIP